MATKCYTDVYTKIKLMIWCGINDFFCTLHLYLINVFYALIRTSENTLQKFHASSDVKNFPVHTYMLH